MRFFRSLATVIIICAASSCGIQSLSETQQPAVEPEQAKTDEFSGMGGADTGLPSARPNEEPVNTQLDPLFYSVYTVEKGDIVGQIAERFGVSQDAIISLNKLKNTRTLQIGQLLKIPSINGIIYTAKKGDTPEAIADKYRISLEKIALANDIEDNVVTQGTVLFLPDAKLDWGTLQEINGDLFIKPLKGGYYISSRYGWRDNPFTGRRTFHNGVDMATSQGTSVYAALDGKVTATGYDVAYGNYVIVSHHSGYQTMYAHLASVLTVRGKYVTTTTRIGTVGNTGQSTGSHLHFTVYKNRATINPVTLWN